MYPYKSDDYDIFSRLNRIDGNSKMLFLAVPWVGLQCVFVVLPDHTHLLFLLFLLSKYSVGLKTLNFFLFY